MADYTGKAQFFVAFKCPPEHEAEGDRIFAQHAEWMERTHPRDGDKALLQHTVSKAHDDAGNALFLLAEVYETKAGIDNHRDLARTDAHHDPFIAWAFDRCQTIGWSDAEVLHSLW